MNASSALTRPTPAQVAWHDYEIGALYHLDLQTFLPGKVEHVVGQAPPDPTLFNPAKLDTDQWVQAAVELGARYALLTVTHESGFMLWPSDAYAYGVKHVAWRDGKGDIVGQFVDSCRRHGIAPGLFIGLRHNTYWDVDGYRVRSGDQAKQAAYIDTCQVMMRELMTRYGPLAEVWMEGGLRSSNDGGPDVLPIVERLQPDTVFYHSAERGDHRWVGNEKGVAGAPCWATMPHPGGRAAHDDPAYAGKLLHGDPDGPFWSPAMCDVPLRDHHWVWHADTEDRIMSVAQLEAIHDQSVGRNAVLTVGLVVDKDGRVPEADARRCAEFGSMNRRRFARPLARGHGVGDTLELRWPGTTRIKCVVLMEDIALGQRVRAYEVDALHADGEWRRICSGESIGHKWIHHIDPVQTCALRLRVTQSIGEPHIRELAVY